jgi:SWI/SNF-related matrix-associated actin-dependent regulator of chromatin subfamily A3
MKYNGIPIINLPECEVMSVKLKFDANLRNQYDLVHSLCKRRIECYLKGTWALNIDDTIGSNWGYVLVMLTRLRQFADHPELIPPDFISKMSVDISDNFENESPEANSILLLEILKAVVDSGEG